MQNNKIYRINGTNVVTEERLAQEIATSIKLRDEIDELNKQNNQLIEALTMIANAGAPYSDRLSDGECENDEPAFCVYCGQLAEDHNVFENAVYEDGTNHYCEWRKAVEILDRVAKERGIELGG